MTRLYKIKKKTLKFKFNYGLCFSEFITQDIADMMLHLLDAPNGALDTRI